MRIAMPVAGESLCMHFGHCEKFYFFDIDPASKKIIKKEALTPPPHEPGLLPRLLHEKGVNVVIAGGMGARAQQLFKQNGIEVLVGAQAKGSLEETVETYLSGLLETGDNPCDH